MEDNRTIKRVGYYSMNQANPQDCLVCHNARFATILINDVCLDCFEKKAKERGVVVAIREMAVASLEPDSFESLQDILDELCKTRHIEPVLI